MIKVLIYIIIPFMVLIPIIQRNKDYTLEHEFQYTDNLNTGYEIINLTQSQINSVQNTGSVISKIINFLSGDNINEVMIFNVGDEIEIQSLFNIGIFETRSAEIVNTKLQFFQTTALEKNTSYFVLNARENIFNELLNQSTAINNWLMNFFQVAFNLDKMKNDISLILSEMLGYKIECTNIRDYITANDCIIRIKRIN